MDASASAPAGWAVFSNNSLERMALAQLLGALGWEPAFCGPHGRRAYATGEAALAPAGCVLAAFDRRGLDAGEQGDLFAHFPEAPLVLFLQEEPERGAVGRVPGNVRAVLDGSYSEELLQAVLRLVAQGHFVLRGRDGAGAEAPEPGAGADAGAAALPPGGRLTGRECEIGAEVAAGRSDKEIGRLLGITANTVNVHLGAIRRKLGVGNRTQVAIWMSRNAPGGAASDAGGATRWPIGGRGDAPGAAGIVGAAAPEVQ